MCEQDTQNLAQHSLESSGAGALRGLPDSGVVNVNSREQFSAQQIRFWADKERKWEWPEPPEQLPVQVVDNHCHLDFAAGPDALHPVAALDKAEAAGVGRIVQVGTDLETSVWSAAFADLEPRVLAAVALHPNDAPDVAASGKLEFQIAKLDMLAAKERVRAIGETGLDYYRTQEDGRRAQQESFEAHIALAKKHGIALQIHDRDAHEDVVATLLRVGAPEKTVFHCFSGDVALAKICNEHGWYMSFSGTATFKNAPYLREAFVVANKELVLVETDSPFLTPEPVRGRPNAPYLMPYTVRKLAAVAGIDVAQMCDIFNRNTEAVYGAWQ